MTWVLGSGTLFGYGALIADVRVSWPGGQVADILQKIHGVAPNMMAGFAGSVRLGFSLVNDMRGCFARTDDALWWPRAAAWWWWRRARGIFRAAPLEEQKKGSAILLVGPGPDETQPWPRSYCVRMKGPDFHPEYLPSIVWHSIGSGRDHDAAKYFANDIKKTTSMFTLKAMFTWVLEALHFSPLARWLKACRKTHCTLSVKT